MPWGLLGNSLPCGFVILPVCTILVSAVEHVATCRSFSDELAESTEIYNARLFLSENAPPRM